MISARKNQSQKIMSWLQGALTLCLLTNQALAGESTNCFYNDELNFVYQLYDYSGNFSNVREYEMKPGVSCDFIVDVNSKVTWWSDNELTARIQVFQDLPGNEHGCQATNRIPKAYQSDTVMNIGMEFNKTCMIKYYLTNNNPNSIQRLQVYKDGDSAVFMKISGIALASAVSLVVSGWLI